MSTTVLVLAGQRNGRPDPLAQAHGLTHKAMIKVGGQALIAYVLQAIEAALPDARILVSIEHWPAIASEPTVARLHRAGRLAHIRSRDTLYKSLTLAANSANFPLIVTTADNVLLTPHALGALVEAGARQECALIALARKEAIEAAHPGGKGRYYEFKNGSFSNCNLFWIGSRDTLHAAETFRDGGQFLKVKGRLAKTFGLLNLILFRLKVLTLEQMCARISRRLQCEVLPLVLDDGRLAIDVDDARSLAMVTDILAEEGRSAEPRLCGARRTG